jgi:hypothetical protein
LCDLYSMTTSQQAIREIAGAMIDRAGDLPPLPTIFPDYAAPIVRDRPQGRELTGFVAKLLNGRERPRTRNWFTPPAHGTVALDAIGPCGSCA